MELIFGVQDLCVPPHWRYPEHQHPGIEVVGVLEGQVTLEVAHEQWNAQQGQVLAIPPHLSHSWFSSDAAWLGVLHLTNTPRDLAQRLLPGDQPRLLDLSEAQFAEYVTLFTRVASLRTSASLQQVRLLRAYLEAFLLVLLEGQQEQDTEQIVMHEIATYMRAHLYQPLKIRQVARQFLMSEVTLRRRFRTAFGISPKQYLLELRLEEAQHLLTTSHLSIREIAHQMGFSDLAHFSATFRHRAGVSPTGWRSRTQK